MLDEALDMPVVRYHLLFEVLVLGRLWWAFVTIILSGVGGA